MQKPLQVTEVQLTAVQVTFEQLPSKEGHVTALQVTLGQLALQKVAQLIGQPPVYVRQNTLEQSTLGHMPPPL